MTDVSPFDVEIRVGEVTDATPFPATHKPEMMKLWIDCGETEFQSAAQLGYNYDPDDVIGRQVLCAVNLGSITIAGFESEALTLGVPDNDGNAVLVSPDDAVSLGGVLH
jgi:tRNA-binding protein